MVSLYLIQRFCYTVFLVRGFCFYQKDGNAVDKKDDIRSDGLASVGKLELVCYLGYVPIYVFGIYESYISFSFFSRDK